jgi:hypothetical protein
MRRKHRSKNWLLVIAVLTLAVSAAFAFGGESGAAPAMKGGGASADPSIDQILSLMDYSDLNF